MHSKRRPESMPALAQGRTPAAFAVACPQCDLLQHLPALAIGQKAGCARCGCVLLSRPKHGDQVPMALTMTALIAFVVANTMPLMDLSVLGRSASTTIIGGAWDLWHDGQPITAMVVAFCAVGAPAIYLVFMLVVLLAARRSVLPHHYGELLRWGLHMREWSMFEVMLIGILVALIKIASLATVNPGIGMVGLVALAFLLPAISVNFEPDRIWRRIALDTSHHDAVSVNP
jgi:paraquat-inducible protein A